MSWKDDAERLLTLGAQHHPNDTNLFVMKIKTACLWGRPGIDNSVSSLPSDCKAQAQQILCDARASGLTDVQIANEIVRLANEPRDPISARDHASTSTSVQQGWDDYCLYYDGDTVYHSF